MAGNVVNCAITSYLSGWRTYSAPNTGTPPVRELKAV